MNLKSHVLPGFISKLLFSGTVFLVNVLVARVAGAADSGSFFYTVNNLAFLVLVSSFSLEAGINYHASRKELTVTDAAAFSISWSIASALIFSFSIFIAPSFFTGFGESVFLPSLLFLAGNLLIGFFSALFYSQKNFGLPQVVTAFSNVLVIIYCTLILTGNLKADNNILVWTYTCSCLLAGLVLAFLFYNQQQVSRLSFDTLKKSYKLIAKYSWMAFIANAAAFLMYRVDYWILSWYSPESVSTASLGNYIQVAKLVQLFLFVPTVFATVIFPVTAADPLASKQPVGKLIYRVTVVNILIVAVMLIAGSNLFTFLFGSDFDEMYSCFALMAPGIVAIACVRVMASYFAGLNQVRLNIAGSMMAFVLIALLNFLLIPKYGINGAAIADSIGYLAYLLFHLYHFNKNTGRA